MIKTVINETVFNAATNREEITPITRLLPRRGPIVANSNQEPDPGNVVLTSITYLSFGIVTRPTKATRSIPEWPFFRHPN